MAYTGLIVKIMAIQINVTILLSQHRRQAESGDSKQMKNWKKAINNENIVRYIKYND
jgi:hypothetical protein